MTAKAAPQLIWARALEHSFAGLEEVGWLGGWAAGL